VACGIDAVGTAIGLDLPPASTDGGLDACLGCPIGFTCGASGCTDLARTHFTLAANPSGAWTWGFRDRDASAGTFAACTVRVHDDVNGIDQWTTKEGGVTPGVFRNPSAAVIHPYGSFTMLPSQIAFHPGPQDQRAIVRWTAPAPRIYAAHIEVVGLSGYMGAPPTTTNVTVTQTLEGGTSTVGSMNVGGDGGLGEAGVGPFSLDVGPTAFAAGDVIDVAVDFGTNGNYGFDSTGVDVTIQAP